MSLIHAFRGDIQKYYDLAAIALIFVLPLSPALTNIVFGIFTLLFVCRVFIMGKLNINKFLIIFIMCFVSLTVLAVVKGGIISDGSFYMRLGIVVCPMLAIPLCERKRQLENAFLAGVFIAVIGSLTSLVTKSGSGVTAVFGNSASVNKILWLERPYFGFMLVLCVFFGLKNKGWLYKAAALFAALFCFYIAARLGIVLIVVTGCVFLYQELRIRKGYKILAMLVTVFLLSILGLLNPNLQERFQINGDFDKTLARTFDYEPRYVIWPCALKLLSDPKIILIGSADNKAIQRYLLSCYDTSNADNLKKKQFYREEKFNTHNQFLDLFVLGGIVPFTLFIYAFLKIWASGRTGFQFKYLTFLLFIFLFFENLLFRQMGLYIFGVFTALYAPGNGQNRLKNP